MGIGSRIGIGSYDWKLRLGNMIRDLYLGIGIEDWDRGLELGIRNGIELEDWD